MNMRTGEYLCVGQMPLTLAAKGEASTYSSFKLHEFTRRKKPVLTTGRINIQTGLKKCTWVVIFYYCCGLFISFPKSCCMLLRKPNSRVGHGQSFVYLVLHKKLSYSSVKPKKRSAMSLVHAYDSTECGNFSCKPGPERLEERKRQEGVQPWQRNRLRSKENCAEPKLLLWSARPETQKQRSHTSYSTLQVIYHQSWTKGSAAIESKTSITIMHQLQVTATVSLCLSTTKDVWSKSL